MLKRNLIRKMGAAALAAFLSIAMLTACGSTASTANASSVASAETTVEKTEPSTEEKTETDDKSTEKTEKPEGDNGDAPDNPPDGNNGEAPGTPPDGNNGEAPGNPPDGGQGGPGGPGGAPGGQSATVTEWDAVNEYSSDETVDSLEVTSTGTDENAVHVLKGAQVIFNNLMITRNSDDSSGGDAASFYGVGASLLATDGTAIVNGGEITSDSKGGAGLYAYGDGIVYAKGTKINTQQDTSGGVHVAGGGKLYAWDLDITTNGGSSAAIRSDRGGGEMIIDGGTYTANGSGSPALYCTADISVNNATLNATGSEGICLEGLNTTRLFNTDLTSNMPDLDQNNGLTWSVIVYQSMSGDSEVGEGCFEMVGGSLKSKNGGLFYTTTTESKFYLNGVDITQSDDCEFFLRATGNDNQRGWGTSGENGADCNFTADNQKMNGDVIWDSISKLDFYMLNGSTLKGAMIDDESAAGSGSDEGYANLYIDTSSKWTVTGDSTVTNLYNAGTIEDTDGKSVTIKGSDGKVYVEGDSKYVITVETYSENVDTSGAVEKPEWSDYEVEYPV
ncbi:MAG: hypothetical protein IJ815_07260 [Lachnospiraceae bacterium]|nr:hypothetical protein [Lachnospiraceae bacterium]